MLHIHTPPAPLSAYIHYFWLWENYHPTHEKERILPHGTMELNATLCDTPMTFYYPQDNYCPQHFRGLVLSGGYSGHFLADTAQPATILSVYFKPGGALPFFGVSAHELHNLHVPLNLLWGRQADDLYTQLLAAPSPEACFAILEETLLATLLQGGERHRAVTYALNTFDQMPAGGSIAGVVEAIGLSATRFIQVFRQDTGFTPKRYWRVLRFQRALALLASQSSPDFVDIALRCGYFDQAHFINDFRAFAGITPSQYRPQFPDHLMNIPFTAES